jgi:hypothetical protein
VHQSFVEYEEVIKRPAFSAVITSLPQHFRPLQLVTGDLKQGKNPDRDAAMVGR